jgi:hypothetical protein
MNWLYFFAGTTGAWVFVGIFIFMSYRTWKTREAKIGEALQKYWAISMSHQKAQIELIKEQNDVMRDIARALNDKSDPCEDEW